MFEDKLFPFHDKDERAFRKALSEPKNQEYLTKLFLGAVLHHNVWYDNDRNYEKVIKELPPAKLDKMVQNFTSYLSESDHDYHTNLDSVADEQLENYESNFDRLHPGFFDVDKDDDYPDERPDWWK